MTQKILTESKKQAENELCRVCVKVSRSHGGETSVVWPTKLFKNTAIAQHQVQQRRRRRAVWAAMAGKAQPPQAAGSLSCNSLRQIFTPNTLLKSGGSTRQTTVLRPGEMRRDTTVRQQNIPPASHNTALGGSSLYVRPQHSSLPRVYVSVFQTENAAWDESTSC